MNVYSYDPGLPLDALQRERLRCAIEVVERTRRQIARECRNRGATLEEYATLGAILQFDAYVTELPPAGIGYAHNAQAFARPMIIVSRKRRQWWLPWRRRKRGAP